MKNKIHPLIYWTPRVLSILLLLFLTLFSFDVFGQGYGFWGTALAFFMHNIPVIIGLILLIIAWKYEIVGSIAFLFGGFFYIFLLVFGGNFEWFMLVWAVQLSGPAFLIGILFWIGWRKKRKLRNQEPTKQINNL